MTRESMQIEPFFDEVTNTVSYIVLDRSTNVCAIVDSVLDYDPKAGRTSTRSADRIDCARARTRCAGRMDTGNPRACGPSVRRALDTAATRRQLGDRRKHRDRAEGVRKTVQRRQRLPARRQSVRPAVRRWRHVHHRHAAGSGAAHAGPHAGLHELSDRRRRVRRRHAVHARLRHRALRLSGRRCAHAVPLDTSLLSLPPETRLFMCHDYLPDGRAAKWESTVAEQRAQNIHVHDGVAEDDFVAMRNARDATLDMPVLILPSVQVNMRAGHLPEPEDNGTRYLKIPIDVL
jgi:hypothetical protein